MKKLLLLTGLVLLCGCTKTSTSITPLQAVGCDIETAVVGAEAGAIATLLSCTDSGAIQSSLETALGNANLCAAPGVSAVSSAQIKSAKSKAVTSKGIIGNIACPIVVNVLIGYASQAVPSGWSCSTGASAASLTAAVTTACEAVVPL